MDQRDLYQRLFNEAQRALLKQEDGVAYNVFYTYQQKLNELIDHLMALNQAGLGDQINLGNWRALSLDKKSLEIIASQMTGINQVIAQQIVDDLKAFSQDAYARAVWGIDQTTPPNVTPVFNPPASDELEKFLMKPWQGERFSDRIWAINDEMALRLQNTLRDGIKSGDSMQDIAAAMRSDVGVPDNAKLVTRPRASAQIYRAMLIARTEAMRLVNAMRQAAWEQNQSLLSDQVWAAAPGLIRVCDDCAERDGMTYDDILDEYGAEDVQPPLHPNCRCIYMAVPKPFKELLGPEFAGIMDESIDQYEMRVPVGVGGGSTSVTVQPYEEWKNARV